MDRTSPNERSRGREIERETTIARGRAKDRDVPKGAEIIVSLHPDRVTVAVTARVLTHLRVLVDHRGEGNGGRNLRLPGNRRSDRR